MKKLKVLGLLTVVSVLAGCAGGKWSGKEAKNTGPSSAAGQSQISTGGATGEAGNGLISQKAFFTPFRDYDSMNDQIKERMDAVGILISNETLVSDGGTGWKLGQVETLKNIKNMCSGEYLADEIAMQGACSAFLIAPDIAVTSGHCMVPDNKVTDEFYGCSEQKMVFGFKKTNSKLSVNFSESQVYKCKELLAHVTDGGAPNPIGPDYSIFRLDRKVTGVVPLKMAKSFINKVGDLATLYVYPLGVSVRTSVGRIASVSPKHFVVPASNYSGSSGGPVMDNKIGEVIGIVQRGEESLVKDEARGCYVTNKCESIGGPQSKCRGEWMYGSAQDQDFQNDLNKVLQQ